MARALNRLGLGRLRNLDPKSPVQRYERQRPGELIPINVKKLARFLRVGHRLTGNRWAYAMPFQHCGERNRWLSRDVSTYNRISSPPSPRRPIPPKPRRNELLC